MLERDTLPENGMAVGCLEVCLLKEVRMSIGKAKQHWEDMGSSEDLKGQALFEEDFYLGNSDKLMYTMKTFHADLHVDNLYSISDPLAVSSLDLQVSDPGLCFRAYKTTTSLGSDTRKSLTRYRQRESPRPRSATTSSASPLSWAVSLLRAPT